MRNCLSCKMNLQQMTTTSHCTKSTPLLEDVNKLMQIHIQTVKWLPEFRISLHFQRQFVKCHCDTQHTATRQSASVRMCGAHSLTNAPSSVGATNSICAFYYYLWCSLRSAHRHAPSVSYFYTNTHSADIVHQTSHVTRRETIWIRNTKFSVRTLIVHETNVSFAS